MIVLSLLQIALSAKNANDQGTGLMYTLALTWPATVCQTQACDFLEYYFAKTFNLHGLWPRKDSSGGCQMMFDCTNEAFNPNELSQQTKYDLEEYWVGVFSKSYYFRRHEWSKHGTCYPSNAQSKQEDYFSTSIKLVKKYNILANWNQAGIVSDDFAGYSKDQLIKHSGVPYIVLACTTVDNKQMLASVYICLDSALVAEKCQCKTYPGQQQSKCTDHSQIFLPTLDSIY